MKKKILFSLLAIAAAAAVVIGGTTAFFSDTETSTGNTFTAGAIDLTIDNESYVTDNSGTLVASVSTSWELSDLDGELFFNFSDLKPGDEGEDTISLHVNDNDAYACMSVAITGTPEYDANESEVSSGDSASDTNGELQNELYFAFWADDGDNVFEVGETIFKEGLVKDLFDGKNWALADAQNNVWTGPTASVPMTGAQTYYIAKDWCYGTMTKTPVAQDGNMDLSGPLVRGTGFDCDGAPVTNVSQTDGILADVAFYAVQSRNNNGFTCASLNEPTSDVVYNSIPDPLAGNYPSQPYEAQSASEFGGQVLLTGINRDDPKVTIMMSSWGCESGSWNLGTCVTTPGATFNHPITLNLYNVNPDNSVGSLIATKTETFAIPYRPSKDAVNCSAGGGWWDGSTCFNGLATPISFDLTGVTLPNNVIVSLAYNTTHHGYSPIGEAATCYAEDGGCGYDSLNVALNTLGSVTYPLPNGAYFNSTFAAFYGDGGTGGTGFFRLDPTGWTGYQPIIKIEAN